MADGQEWERLKKWEMTVVEKELWQLWPWQKWGWNPPNSYIAKKGSIHPFVEVYRPLEQPRSMGWSHVNLLEEKENLAKLMASGTIGRMMVNDKI